MPHSWLEQAATISACDMPMKRPRVLIAGALAGAIAVWLTLAALQRGDDEPAACAPRDFEGSRFIVCTLDATRDELRLAAGHNGAPLRRFAALSLALGDEARKVRFAMNAGMFNEAGEPIGLYIENGEELHVLRLTDGPGNFHMKPNGVFWQGQDGALHVDTSETFAAERPPARWATQSGPMLLVDGEMHPRFAEDGASRLVRNGVGLSDPRTAYFVISSGFVSFGRFARFFRDELGCTDALFLDGSVSSLWAPELNRRDDDHALGPMAVVLRRD